jgi:hypothetical protein
LRASLSPQENLSSLDSESPRSMPSTIHMVLVTTNGHARDSNNHAFPHLLQQHISASRERTVQTSNHFSHLEPVIHCKNRAFHLKHLFISQPLIIIPLYLRGGKNNCIRRTYNATVWIAICATKLDYQNFTTRSVHTPATKLKPPRGYKQRTKFHVSLCASNFQSPNQHL